MEQNDLSDHMAQALEEIIPVDTLRKLSQKPNAPLHIFDTLLNAYLDLKAMPFVTNETYNTILLREKNTAQMESVIESLRDKYIEYKESNDAVLHELRDKLQAKNRQLQQQDEHICHLASESNKLRNILNNNQLLIAQLREENQQISVLQEDNEIIEESVNEMSKQAQALEETVAQLRLQNEALKGETEALGAELAGKAAGESQQKLQFEQKIAELAAQQQRAEEELQMQKISYEELENDVNVDFNGIISIEEELQVNQVVHQLQDEISALKEAKIQLEDQVIQHTAAIAQLTLELGEVSEENEQLRAAQGEMQARFEEAASKGAAAQKTIKELQFDAEKVRQQAAQLEAAQKSNEQLATENQRLQAESKRLQQEEEQLQRYQQQVMADNKQLQRRVEEMQAGQASHAESSRELEKYLLAVFSAYLRQMECIMQPGVLRSQHAKQVIEEYVDSCQDFEDLLGALQLLKMDSCGQTLKRISTLLSETTVAKTMVLSQLNILAQTQKVDFVEGSIIDVEMSNIAE